MTALQLINKRLAYSRFHGEIEGIVKAITPIEDQVIKVIREQLEVALKRLDEDLGETKS